jgi:hypothetical protein
MSIAFTSFMSVLYQFYFFFKAYLIAKTETFKEHSINIEDVKSAIIANKPIN